jgi:ABC-type phosphate/phosphonate transport system substrate-binding protein
MSRKFESERPEIYVIWWNDGLLGYNVNVSDDQQPIQKSKWFIFLNKLSIVENTKKIINEKN